MIFVMRKCSMCSKLRKFVEESSRDITGICGECWDWGNKEKITGL